MFRELKQIWEEQEFTSNIVNEFVSMLESSHDMLSYVDKILFGKGKGAKGQKKIYLKDQMINITEKEIRKRILIHLTTNPKGNLPACLALISVTKDAERIGDYVKNMYELHAMIAQDEEVRKVFRRRFDPIFEDVLTLIEDVGTAFRESNVELGLDTASRGRNISKECENIINDLLGSNESTRTTVICTLASRYLKRISLHLVNVASSIFLPMPEMDYIKSVRPKSS